MDFGTAIEKELITLIIQDPHRVFKLLYDNGMLFEHDDFATPLCHELFKAIEGIIEDDLELTAATFYFALRQRRIMSEIDFDAMILNRYTKDYPDNYILHIARAVREEARKRSLADLERKTKEILNNQDPNLQSYDQVEKAKQKLQDWQDKNAPVQINEKYSTAFSVMQNYIEDLKSGKVLSKGLSSGFTALDAYTNGFFPSFFYVCGARPGVGKTAFALNIAFNVATINKPDFPVIVFEMEMNDTEIMQRIIASRLQLEARKQTAANVLGRKDEILIQLNNLAYHNDAGEIDYKKCRLLINTENTVTLETIRSVCDKVTEEYGGVGMIIIDYLQLLSIPAAKQRKNDNRNNELSIISQGLKNVAADYNCSLFALVQLNRDIEKRTDFSPKQSDIRDCGWIEQAANFLMFLDRPKLREKAETEDFKLGPEVKPNAPAKLEKEKAFAYVKKNRSGGQGVFPLDYYPEITLFTNCEEEGGANFEEVKPEPQTQEQPYYGNGFVKNYQS